MTEPAPAVVQGYDTDADGTISIAELSAAAVDFAAGELTVDELSEVATAYAS